MKPEFYKYNKYLSGSGANLAIEFIKSFQNEFCEKIKRYAYHRINEGYFEHLFYYGEQQTKTYVTSVLNDICDTNFMQEAQVTRSFCKPKGKRALPSNGRVDYWCSYGEKTAVSILLEVKQAWIRYYKSSKWTIYKDGLSRHINAVKQLKNIEDKKEFTSKNGSNEPL